MKRTTALFFNSLSARIFAFFWLALCLLLALIFFLPYLDARIYTELRKDEVSGYHKTISSAIRHRELERILAGKPVLSFDKFDKERPVLIDQKGNVLGASEDEVNLVRRFSYRSQDISKPLKKNFQDIQIAGPFSVFLSEDNASYSLYFVERVNPQKELISFIFDRPLVLIILIMLVSTPVLWWLSYSIGKPLSALQKAANAVALGNFKVDKRLQMEGTIEIRQVGASFNRMTKALEDLLSGQQSLLSSISHELRTPLTRLQLSLALLRRRVGESSEVARIEKESLLLERMINDLLMLSRQQLNSHIVRDTFTVNELWDEVIEDATFEAEQRQLTFSVHQQISDPTRLFINGNRGLLVSAVENIVRNALKYTLSAIKMTISLSEEHSIHIIIDDNGAGVPESEYENIFKPFYRIDEARTRTTGGTGLGLAIVASVVNEHQGKVVASKSPLGGLRVMIELPLWIK